MKKPPSSWPTQNRLERLTEHSLLFIDCYVTKKKSRKRSNLGAGLSRFRQKISRWNIVSLQLSSSDWIKTVRRSYVLFIETYWRSIKETKAADEEHSLMGVVCLQNLPRINSRISMFWHFVQPIPTINDIFFFTFQAETNLLPGTSSYARERRERENRSRHTFRSWQDGNFEKFKQNSR